VELNNFLFFYFMVVKKFYIGAHASMAKGFKNALISIEAIGGNAVQVFLKSPRSRVAKDLNVLDAKNSMNYLKEKDIFLVGHCSYLLNFAKCPDEHSWAVNSLIDDLERMSKLGGVGVVLHIGKFLDMEHSVAFENIKKSVSLVLEQSPKDVKVIFENTAGQGTEIGFRFDELAQIYNLFSVKQKERIGFCLDTCHSHVAGYDLSSKVGVDTWQAEFDKLIGWEKVVCIHLNDTNKGCGSRVDRHEDLGYGTIGEDGLKGIVQVAVKSGVPLILETPSNHFTYADQIELVKDWASNL